MGYSDILEIPHFVDSLDAGNQIPAFYYSDAKKPFD